LEQFFQFARRSSMGEETNETGVEQPLESDVAVEDSAAVEGAENTRSEAATRSGVSGGGVAVAAIIVFGAVALACILALTAISIAFISNAPW
jgi:hypothetical protein